MGERQSDPQATLDQQIEVLRSAQEGSIDPCQNATFIAVNNPDVRELLVKTLENQDYASHGVYCLERRGELIDVVFDFRCRPEVFCLASPAFLVCVNLVYRRVEGIVEHYEPHHEHEHQRPPHYSCTCCSPFSLFCMFWYPWLAARSAFWEAICCPPMQDTISRLESPRHHRLKPLPRGG